MLQARRPHDFFFHMKTHLQLLLRYYTLYSGNYTVWIGTVSIKKIVSSEVYYTLGCDIGYMYNDVSLKSISCNEVRSERLSKKGIRE
jgi:lantibiotic modifying enzyme